MRMTLKSYRREREREREREPGKSTMFTGAREVLQVVMMRE